MATSRPRKKLFVDTRVQGVLIRQLMKHWIIACSVIFLYLLIIQTFSSTERLTFRDHLSLMWTNYGVLLLALFTVFPVFVYDSIRLSNRFAGPMVSFRNALDRLSRGEPVNSLSFRKNDFWHDFSTHLNSVARRMNLLNETPNVGSGKEPA